MSGLRAEAEAAAERLDAALAAGPDVRHEDLAAAVAAIAALRNGIAARARAGGADRDLLDRANALLSLAYGAEAPLAGLHLERAERARDGLRSLMAGSVPG